MHTLQGFFLNWPDLRRTSAGRCIALARRLQPVTIITNALKVVEFVGATLSLRDDVVDLYSLNGVPMLEAWLAQMMVSLKDSEAKLAPATIVTPFR